MWGLLCSSVAHVASWRRSGMSPIPGRTCDSHARFQPGPRRPVPRGQRNLSHAGPAAQAARFPRSWLHSHSPRHAQRPIPAMLLLGHGPALTLGWYYLWGTLSGFSGCRASSSCQLPSLGSLSLGLSSQWARTLRSGRDRGALPA